MKSIMLSVQPKWVAKILNKGKTIEVRKQFPKKYVGWVYIYCCKQKKNEIGCHINYKKVDGKVVARFWCDKVSKIKRFMESDHGEFAFAYWDTKPFPNIENIETKSCLTTSELDKYARSKGKIDSVKLNAIHITKLEIFDKPKELSGFNIKGKYICSKSGCPYFATEKCRYASECLYEKTLTKAPQNFMFIDID